MQAFRESFLGNGVVCFAYLHDGRRECKVKIDVKTGGMQYVSYTGLETEWHGKAWEVNAECEGRHGVKIHQIVLQGLHSPYGIPTTIRFKQCGRKTWKATGRRGDTIYLTFKHTEHDTTEEVPDPAQRWTEAIPLEDGQQWQII